MKKLFLFLTLSSLSISLNSCSGDDSNDSVNPANSTLSMKVNGTVKTYNTVAVSQDDQGNGDVYLTVTASQAGSPNDLVNFSTYVGETGIYAIYQFEVIYNGQAFNAGFGGNGNLNNNVIVNSNNRLQGTFSGTITRYNNQTQQEETINVTEGSYNIVY